MALKSVYSMEFQTFGASIAQRFASVEYDGNRQVLMHSEPLESSILGMLDEAGLQKIMS